MSGLLSRILSRLSGARPAASPYDGVVHKVGGVNGHALAFAERSAIARALNKIGFNNNDPNELRAAVDRYTDLARRFVKAYPDHPLSTHYTAKANQINAPDVHRSDAGWKTVPTTGPVGEELGIAATPLVRFLNRLSHHMSGEKILNVQPAESTSEPAPPVIKRPSEYVPPTPSPVTSRTHKPIPLVGEPAANRWKDLDTLHASGADRNAMISHLMNVHSTTRRQAGDTIRRWARAKK